MVEFLHCRTPAAWVDAAIGNIELLLQDHATLELKAAQQAQTMIRKYGAGGASSGSAPFRASLLHKMSRLAREELRHFEQVVERLDARGLSYCPVSASRYATGLRAEVRNEEPGRLIDTLLSGAIIEARSCERFASLAPALEPVDPALAKFYRSLLRSEARHYQDYLWLARLFAETNGISQSQLDSKEGQLLQVDRDLVLTEDDEFRFHSGIPVRATSSEL